MCAWLSFHYQPGFSTQRSCSYSINVFRDGLLEQIQHIGNTIPRLPERDDIEHLVELNQQQINYLNELLAKIDFAVLNASKSGLEDLETYSLRIDGRDDLFIDDSIYANREMRCREGMTPLAELDALIGLWEFVLGISSYPPRQR